MFPRIKSSLLEIFKTKIYLHNFTQHDKKKKENIFNKYVIKGKLNDQITDLFHCQINNKIYIQDQRRSFCLILFDESIDRVTVNFVNHPEEDQSFFSVFNICWHAERVSRAATKH